ncbi:MAG: sterol desaturase family protein [Chitinophagaceae bacterium]
MDSVREQLLIFISAPFYVIIILLEIIISNVQHRPAYTFRDTLANIYLLLANSGLDLLFRTIYIGILVFFYNRQVFHFANPFVYWLVLIVAEDFLYYWLHRLDHEVRLFWAVHVTHHSSENMNFAVGFRSSVFQPLYRFIFFIPLSLAGFSPVDIVFIYSATQIWGIFVHTELITKMGWLEYMLVTPSHHRVHHASNPKYLDKNMGMFLIIWDKIFGTFQPELCANYYQPIKYGLTTPLEKPNALSIIFHEWNQIKKDCLRKDLNAVQKIYYVFGPPGWSHDGTRMTSKALRKKECSEDLPLLEPGHHRQPHFDQQTAFSARCMNPSEGPAV